MVVARDRQHGIDADVARVDEEILGLLARETFADDMRDGGDAVLVLDQRAGRERAGSTPDDVPIQPVRAFIDVTTPAWLVTSMKAGR